MIVSFVLILVQLDKCDVVCDSVVHRVYSAHCCLSASILFRYEPYDGAFVFWGARVRRVEQRTGTAIKDCEINTSRGYQMVVKLH